MTDLQNLLPDIYVIPGSTNVGAVRVGNDIYLIDSGGANDGERICDALDGAFGKGAYTVRAIINTHSHADHAGGNAYIVKKTGCGVWISRGEKEWLENTMFEPALIWGGNPPSELRSKYFVLDAHKATRVIGADDIIKFDDGKEISFVPLPGHYIDMLGVIVAAPDGRRVLFAADAVFGKNFIARFSIPFMFDVGAFLRTLDTLCEVKADFYVPSHGDAVTRIDETAEMNKIAVLGTVACIIKILKRKPLSTEELLTEVANENAIPMKFAQYVLIGCTLRSFLTYLYNEKKVAFEVVDNKMLWRAA